MAGLSMSMPNLAKPVGGRGKQQRRVAPVSDSLRDALDSKGKSLPAALFDTGDFERPDSPPRSLSRSTSLPAAAMKRCSTAPSYSFDHGLAHRRQEVLHKQYLNHVQNTFGRNMGMLPMVSSPVNSSRDCAGSPRKRLERRSRSSSDFSPPLEVDSLFALPPLETRLDEEGMEAQCLRSSLSESPLRKALRSPVFAEEAPALELPLCPRRAVRSPKFAMPPLDADPSPSPTSPSSTVCSFARSSSKGSSMEDALEFDTPRSLDCDVSHIKFPTLPGGPTFEETLKRLRKGRLDEVALARSVCVYNLFSNGEVMDREHLGQVFDVLGYAKISKVVLKALVDEVSDRQSLDLGDALLVVQTYAERERKMLRAIFAERARPLVEDSSEEDDSPKRMKSKDCANGGREVSMDQLFHVMKDLGIVMLRSALSEMREHVGVAGQSDISFHSFLKVLAGHRTCEGFREVEWKKAQKAFNEAKEGPEDLPADKLADVMLEVFGVHCIKHLRALLGVAGDALKSKDDVIKRVSFHDFLAWARMLQNAELTDMYKLFEKTDTDRDGIISFEELTALIKHSGFTLFESEALGFLKATGILDKEESGFTFDDAVNYLSEVRKSEGFNQQELDELTSAYNKFDTDGEGEIDTLQVLDLLRYLGYQVQVEDVKDHANKVDFNGNGTMDVHEYLRLMRLHREDELDKSHKVFVRLAGGRDELLSCGKLHAALTSTSGCGEYGHVFDEICLSVVEAVSLDEFKLLADKGRKAVKHMQRKKANFSDREFKVLEQTFQEYDVYGQGFLEKAELLQLLLRCGLAVHTSHGQAVVTRMLDLARQTASDTEPGSSDVTFGVMVQLWRKMARESEAKHMEHMEQVRVASGFSVSEAAEFLQIFSHWRGKAKAGTGNEPSVGLDRPASAKAHVESKSVRSYSIFKGCSSVSTEMLKLLEKDSQQEICLETVIGCADNLDLLNFESLKQILVHLNMRVGNQQLQDLQKQLQKLTGDPHGAMDFPNFLLLMQWMLTRDFAGVNACAARLAVGK